MAAKFITFEGGEGAGKSTQVKLLAEFLRGAGHEVVITREPGGTPAAEEIRELLLNPPLRPSLREGKGEGFFDPVSEVLLNFAARHDHVENLIKPALARGAYVLCDRFFDSTYAYQGVGQGVDAKLIDDVRAASIGSFAPDITFILDIDPVVALKRAAARGDENRFERMGLPFHQKIRIAFLENAAANPQRCKVVDASLEAELVQCTIRNLLD